MLSNIPAVRLKSITKRFGNNLANDNVSFDINPGKIHAIIGENGAGKSTVMKILFGFYQAEKGDIEIFGNKVNITSPTDALSLGIGMVHQHFMLVNDMTVAENIVLGIEPSDEIGRLAIEKSIQAIKDFSQKYNLSINPNTIIDELTVGEKQRVEIIKAIFRKARILILDEPTAVLTPQEVKDLFNILYGLKQENIVVVIISHKLDEILEISDRISVMRAGRHVGDIDTKDANPKILAKMMVGRDVLLGKIQAGKIKEKKKVLEIKDLSAVSKSDKAIKNINIEISAGEILGVAGISGNGQTTLENTLSGLLKVQSGQILFNGERIEHLNVKERKQLRIGHVPSDREKHGYIKQFSNAENLILGYHFHPEYCDKYGMLDLKNIDELSLKSLKEYDVRPLETKSETGRLSGGNKQKVILAREIGRKPKLLIIAEPTRGVDIGAIETIRKFIIDIKNHGTAILLISSDLDEINDLSDRTCVFHKGEIVGSFDTNQIDKEQIGLMMTGQKISAQLSSS